MPARSKEFWRRGDWFPLAELAVSSQVQSQTLPSLSHLQEKPLKYVWQGGLRSSLGSSDMRDAGPLLWASHRQLATGSQSDYPAPPMQRPVERSDADI